MRPEEEMILCFMRAGVLMHSLTFYVMGAADTRKAFDEFIILAGKIGTFVKRATGKDEETVANLAMELIQNQSRAEAFVRENATAIAT